MTDLPLGTQIVGGTLKVRGHNIFLRNITSTRVAIEDSALQVTKLGILSLFGGVALGLGLQHWLRTWASALLCLSVGIFILVITCKRRTTYVLIVVTAAGEIKALVSEDRGMLEEITDAISVAISDLGAA